MPELTAWRSDRDAMGCGCDVVESKEAYRGKLLLVRSLAGQVPSKQEAVEGCRRVQFAGFSHLGECEWRSPVHRRGIRTVATPWRCSKVVIIIHIRVPGNAPVLERTTIPFARAMYPFMRF